MKKKVIIVSLIVLSLTLIPAVVLANTIYGNLLIGQNVNAHLYIGMQGVSVFKAMVWMAIFIIIGFVLLIVLNNGLRLIGVF